MKNWKDFSDALFSFLPKGKPKDDKEVKKND